MKGSPKTVAGCAVLSVLIPVVVIGSWALTAVLVSWVWDALLMPVFHWPFLGFLPALGIVLLAGVLGSVLRGGK